MKVTIEIKGTSMRLSQGKRTKTATVTKEGAECFKALLKLALRK